MEFDPSQYPHSFSREVYLCETDAFGHVNSVSFIAYLESARFDLFKKLELFNPKDLLAFNLIIARIECDYKNIARYNDKLTIYTRVAEIRSSSFILEHVFLREEDSSIVAKGRVVLVAFDHAHNRPQPIPQEWRGKLTRYQGSSEGAKK